MEFKEIDCVQYIRNRKTKVARKIAKIKAIQATENTVIETVMKDGHKETINVASPGDYIVTNPSGEQYVIKEKDFDKRYKSLGEGVYQSLGSPVSVCELDINVKFKAPWGEDMYIKEGGYLIINKPDDIYGIQKEEFYETYEIIGE